MPKSLTQTEADSGWIITMSPEMARLAGVAEGSQIVFYVSHRDAFSEMKRLGD